tara:strand:- start:80492 stop:80821 length:330 start_codon:yes stop_codon:yes gene_type:complete
MLTIRRPDTPVLHGLSKCPSGRYSWLRALLFVPLLSLIPFACAQAAPGAQKAIEALENCSQQDRKSGCVKILKRKPSGEDRQAIKAQVRGGRIIWYEYNVRTGSVRRTN